MGLGFELGQEENHRTVGKTGVLSGFHSAMSLAPDAGIGVLILSNTGGLDGRGGTVPLATMLVRLLLGLAVDPIRMDIAPRAEAWSDLCGWYSPAPGSVTNLFPRALMGAGAEVMVQVGHLRLKPLTPIPAMRRGFRLYPDDPDDPRAFRIYLPEFGMNLQVVFDGGPEEEPATRLMLDLMSFERRPDLRNPRPWLTAVAVAGVAALAVRSLTTPRRGGRRASCQRTRRDRDRPPHRQPPSR
jgi:hypothetical protein